MIFVRFYDINSYVFSFVSDFIGNTLKITQNPGFFHCKAARIIGNTGTLCHHLFFADGNHGKRWWDLSGERLLSGVSEPFSERLRRTDVTGNIHAKYQIR